MTYVGHSTRTSSRVLTALVIIAIVAVAFWAASGGLDDIQSPQAETVIVTE